MRYLFFDTETTGLPRDYKAPACDTSNWPRLVQLSWIVQDAQGNTLLTGNYIIKPDGFTIPEAASSVHGITTERALREGAPLRSVLDEFVAEVRLADIVIGHNIDFDMKVAGCECYRMYGRDYLAGKPTVDTMKKSTNFCAIPSNSCWGGYKWPKLQELHQKLFGYQFEDAHDSSADIAATAKCYWELKRRGII